MYVFLLKIKPYVSHPPQPQAEATKYDFSFPLNFVQVENQSVWFTLNLELHIFSSIRTYVASIARKKADNTHSVF